MQGYLELHNIPYTGSGVMASALAMDKLRTKQIWTGCGVPTPPYCNVTKSSDLALIAEILGFPMMIKPIHEGSSIGMSKVNSEDELHRAVEKAFEYDNELIAEKWMTGKEYTVAILNGKALPAIRLETPHSFYDYEAKYQSDSTQYHCPAGLAKEKEIEIKELALKAFNAVDASGWGRVDVMADDEGNFYPIEINTLPGMTDHSLVPMAAKAEGISFNDLVWLILETSIVQGGSDVS